MKITADTNVLIRAAVWDDPAQSQRAADVLREAELIAVPVAALCEFVWVLRRGYKKTAIEAASIVRRLIDSKKVVVERPVIDAGMAVLDAGGDFADGVIAFEGRRHGAEFFVTFDQKAARLVMLAGFPTSDLGRS